MQSSLDVVTLTLGWSKQVECIVGEAAFKALHFLKEDQNFNERTCWLSHTHVLLGPLKAEVCVHVCVYMNKMLE